jgi:NADH dehydrogenase [ubiquinone] 1 alpha subcomplex assembly factor 7
MLDALVKSYIRQKGAMSVEQFMQLALYDPEYGYYTSKEPFGRGGDFITAPEISQLFGEMIGLWVADFWLRSGSPKLRLVECGGGRGTLMQDILRTTKNLPNLHSQLQVTMVEISPRLIALQQAALQQYPFISWAKDLGDIPDDCFTIIIGNEFLDALPIKQYVGDTERKITLNTKGELEFSINGVIREECPAMESVIYLTARLLKQGGACLWIDYGFSDKAPPEGTLQAVKAHQYHHIFADIGAADLTALVDFTAVAKHAENAGLKVHPPITQGLFLERMGIRTRAEKLAKNASAAQKLELSQAVDRLLSPTQMGTLFKLMCLTHQESITPYAIISDQ